MLESSRIVDGTAAPNQSSNLYFAAGASEPAGVTLRHNTRKENTP